MRRWLVALAVSVVATATAVTVNIATELKQHVWAWIAVGVLTVLTAAGTVVTSLMHRANTRADAGRVGRRRQAGHSAEGTVTGLADPEGAAAAENPPTTQVNQTAVAAGNATIQQAGRDIRTW